MELSSNRSENLSENSSELLTPPRHNRPLNLPRMRREEISWGGRISNVNGMLLESICINLEKEFECCEKGK